MAGMSEGGAVIAEPATGLLDLEATDIGSVFVSNYPPYSAWNSAAVGEAMAALDRESAAGASLGLYIHIPFCRKRCKFCYFRVYIDKNHEQIGRYLDALGAELERYAERAAIQGPKAGLCLLRRRYAVPTSPPSS